jgi:predicted metal-dependent TIM-barrel fold hydrolase
VVSPRRLSHVHASMRADMEASTMPAAGVRAMFVAADQKSVSQLSEYRTHWKKVGSCC